MQRRAFRRKWVSRWIGISPGAPGFRKMAVFRSPAFSGRWGVGTLGLRDCGRSRCRGDCRGSGSARSLSRRASGLRDCGLSWSQALRVSGDEVGLFGFVFLGESAFLGLPGGIFGFVSKNSSCFSRGKVGTANAELRMRNAEKERLEGSFTHEFGRAFGARGRGAGTLRWAAGERAGEGALSATVRFIFQFPAFASTI